MHHRSLLCACTVYVHARACVCVCVCLCGYVCVYVYTANIRTSEFKSPRVCQDIPQELYT